MTSTQTRVNVRIMDHDFQVACPPEEEGALLESAALLDRQMRDIRKTGAIVGMDRIAVMAALNLAHDSLQGDDTRKFMDDNVTPRLRRMQDKLELALAETQLPSTEH